MTHVLQPSIDGVERSQKLKATLIELAQHFPRIDAGKLALDPATSLAHDHDNDNTFSATFRPAWPEAGQASFARKKLPSITYDADTKPGVGSMAIVGLHVSKHLLLPLEVAVRLGHKVWPTHRAADKPAFIVILRHKSFYVCLRGFEACELRDGDRVVYPSELSPHVRHEATPVFAHSIVFYLTQDASGTASFLDFTPISIADATQNILLPTFAKHLLRDAVRNDVNKFFGIIGNAQIVLRYELA